MPLWRYHTAMQLEIIGIHDSLYYLKKSYPKFNRAISICRYILFLWNLNKVGGACERAKAGRKKNSILMLKRNIFISERYLYRFPPPLPCSEYHSNGTPIHQLHENRTPLSNLYLVSIQHLIHRLLPYFTVVIMQYLIDYPSSCTPYRTCFPSVLSSLLSTASNRTIECSSSWHASCKLININYIKQIKLGNIIFPQFKIEK